MSLTERLIALILLVGFVLSLFHLWEYYDTGFASDYAPGYARGYVYIRWFIGGLTELVQFWLQARVLFSLVAIVAFFFLGGPSYSKVNRTRSTERP